MQVFKKILSIFQYSHISYVEGYIYDYIEDHVKWYFEDCIQKHVEDNIEDHIHAKIFKKVLQGKKSSE